jgi:hypothetical protein
MHGDALNVPQRGVTRVASERSNEGLTRLSSQASVKSARARQAINCLEGERNGPEADQSGTGLIDDDSDLLA